jgi:hypothetical protein
MRNNRKLTIKIDGFADNDFSVISLIGEEVVSKPFFYEIELFHKDKLKAKDLLGKEATITLQNIPKNFLKRYFSGRITSFAYNGTTQTEDKIHLYTIMLSPDLELMKYSCNTRSFVKKSIKDIIGEIKDKWNFTKLQFDCNFKDIVIRQVEQDKEDDYTFLDRLLKKFGIYYYYEHENGSYNLIFSDKAPWVQAAVKCCLDDYKETENIGFQKIDASIYDFTSVNTTDTVLNDVNHIVESSVSCPSDIQKNMTYQYVLDTSFLFFNQKTTFQQTSKEIDIKVNGENVKIPEFEEKFRDSFKGKVERAENAVAKLAYSEASMQHNIYGVATEGKELHSGEKNEFLYSFFIGQAYRLEDRYNDLCTEALFIKELKFKVINNSFGEKGIMNYDNSLDSLFVCKFKAQPNAILFAPPLHSIKTNPVSVNFF